MPKSVRFRLSKICCGSDAYPPQFFLTAYPHFGDTEYMRFCRVSLFDVFVCFVTGPTFKAFDHILIALHFIREYHKPSSSTGIVVSCRRPERARHGEMSLTVSRMVTEAQQALSEGDVEPLMQLHQCSPEVVLDKELVHSVKTLPRGEERLRERRRFCCGNGPGSIRRRRAPWPLFLVAFVVLVLIPPARGIVRPGLPCIP